MAVACGLVVASLVYVQPLMAAIAESFSASADQVGLVATLGQLGSGVGLILIVPLAEKYNMRLLIIIILCALTVALTGMAIAPTIAFLSVASAVVGLASNLPELLIPLAAKLASSNERGHVVGIMSSAILVGTLLANFLSGLVGEYLGWRAMYWIATAMTTILAVALYLVLPADHAAKSKVSYPKLLSSLWSLLISEPVLQEISVIIVLVYGSFSAFWVTISFFLETPPYHYGSDAVGLLGLVGIAGASAASFVGKLADREDSRYANAIALPIALVAFMMMWLVGKWLIGLIISAVLLDLGTQSCLVANQTRIYTLEPSAWHRLNTVSIFMLVLGSSFGSVVGVLAWGVAKWNGVCSIGFLMLAGALGFYIFHGKRIQQWKESQDQQNVSNITPDICLT